MVRADLKEDVNQIRLRKDVRVYGLPEDFVLDRAERWNSIHVASPNKLRLVGWARPTDVG